MGLLGDDAQQAFLLGKYFSNLGASTPAAQNALLLKDFTG